jgi:leader peptidase (prepilin peptidase)/N-methyltransferase
MIVFIFFIFGLIIGSFLNAVIFRFWEEKPIAMDRSICPHCKHVLSPFDLIPVLSFIFLRGRCRYCKKKISLQYPIVELVTGISFALLAIHHNLQPTTLDFWFQLVFIAFFIEIAVFDLKHYLILDKILLPASILAFVYAIYMHALIPGLIGVAIISGFFALQYFISGGKWIGFGDVKLGVFLGLVFGVGNGLVLLFFAYMTGAMVGLLLIWMGKKDLGSRLPFGTFLCFCGIIILLYGDAIKSWYLGIIGF